MPAGQFEIGRPVQSKLVIEVFDRFKRWDSRYAGARRELYPHLVTDAPGIGGPGTGSVNWVGLNPDPCRAKFLAKSGITTVKKPRPQSAPAARAHSDSSVASVQHGRRGLGRPASASSTRSASGTTVGATPVDAKRRLQRPRSAPSGGSRAVTAVQHQKQQEREEQHEQQSQIQYQKQPLEQMSCISHYLNQMYDLPGKLPPETYGPNGPWPKNGAQRPVDLRELLYDGTTAEDKGRKGYLLARRTFAPQEKSQTAVTAAQEVGWDHHEGKVARCYHPTKAMAAKSIVPC